MSDNCDRSHPVRAIRPEIGIPPPSMLLLWRVNQAQFVSRVCTAHRTRPLCYGRFNHGCHMVCTYRRYRSASSSSTAPARCHEAIRKPINAYNNCLTISSRYPRRAAFMISVWVPIRSRSRPDDSPREARRTAAGLRERKRHGQRPVGDVRRAIWQDAADDDLEPSRTVIAISVRKISQAMDCP